MAAITYDEIERNADRTFAYALLVRAATRYLTVLYRLTEVAGSMDGLLGDLTPETVEALAAESSEVGGRLRSRLQEIHHLLARFSRSEHAEKTSRLPILGHLVARIQESTEDLGDIIDTLALASNPDFKNLVSCCASTLGIQQPEEVVGRMHG